MAITMEHSIPVGLSLCLVYLLTKLIRFSLLSLRPKHYPPGPLALPFIGNLHLFANTKPFVQFTALRQKYGDIVGLKTGPGHLVILNSAALVRELLEKRGTIYSGRPFPYLHREYTNGAHHILFMPYDGYLRQWKTAVRYLLSQAGAERILPIQDAASVTLMQNLASKPDHFMNHFRTWSLTTPFIAICGSSALRKEPGLIKSFFENQEDWLKLLTPGVGSLVDIFPILSYVPEFLADWKRNTRLVHNNQQDFYYMMLEFAKQERARSKNSNENVKQHESLLVKILREQEEGEQQFDDDQLAYLGGGLLEAAVDTTFATFMTLIKALASHPEVLKNVQYEVDAVCGSERLPKADDLKKLPYLRACFFESLRWRPATPTTLPHVLDADDTIGGYHLKQGTVLLQNTWAITHDPKDYDHPEEFDPSRYLDNPYGTKRPAEASQAEGRKQVYVFGTGRRQCPGDLFGENSVLIATAKLVWVFHIVSKGELDNSIESGFHGGLTFASEEFKVDFVPRSVRSEKVLLEDYQRLNYLLE
ncbi:cytochrome P450 [Pseudomassariella vexata]|uniref:Cytochrome P450 n=1 Tax=Pseudomassariella vexata TaxID=1141098 RepID=A0A1Y2E4R5_9PEZI|nr:cytochrome P450 [Pseudomassariella vexata]ORY66548.1 cytochrome P450 [Pseudomassariella vexata]